MSQPVNPATQPSIAVEDRRRSPAPNSLSACIRAYDMMFEPVYGPGGLLEVINGDGSEPLVRPQVRHRKTGICLKLTGRERKKPGSASCKRHTL